MLTVSPLLARYLDAVYRGGPAPGDAVFGPIALSRRRVRPTTIATVPTGSATFGLLLAGVVIGVGGLTFLPALVLGPVAQLLMS